MKQHVFIIGSKGIPAKYGGFETFVDRLTYYAKNKNIRYHVACLLDGKDEEELDRSFTYQDAMCFGVRALNIGSARAIFYDLDALKFSLRYIKANHIEHPIIYILACRIGPFIGYYKKQIEKLGGKLYVNPDGHEWKRSKWSRPVKEYWRFSERYMVKHADLLVCDSRNIQKYIETEYKGYRPKTTFIAYGSDVAKAELADNDPKLLKWYEEKKVQPHGYYLIVGRFVPENNYETMIREFMASDTKKDLVIITGIEHSDFYEKLRIRTGFDKDDRIKFVGTVYDTELLKKIRENAWAYLHGHEVGGTNPSLLEALASTRVNLLLNVGFNHEVGEDGALYWNKEQGNLAELIHQADQMTQNERAVMEERAKKRIQEEYSWDHIVDQYEEIFLK